MYLFFYSHKYAIDFLTAKLHVLGEIDDLSAECKEHLSRRTKAVSNKITDIVNLQKNTSADLSDIEEKVGQMEEEVDRVIEEQVSLC